MGMPMEMDMPLNTEPVYEDQLLELGQQLQAEGISCRTDLRRGGIDDAILDAAKDHQADLIITGRSYIGNFFDRLAGSVASDIARGAHCPVLIIPSGNSEEATEHTPTLNASAISLQTIVFSTPLEFNETGVFQQVIELARTFSASLRLLRVVAENQPAVVDDNEMLGPLQTVYGNEPLVVDTVESSTVTGGIDDYLSKSTVDLLVMTTRERGFLAGLLNPSLTNKMVIQSEVPLLVYQAEEAL